MDNIYINEISGYPISITLQKMSTDDLTIYVKGEINKLIDNYDNVNERRPIHKDENNLLEMYI